MQMHRRVERRLNGTYAKDKFIYTAAKRTVLALVLLSTIAAVSSSGSDTDKGAVVAIGLLIWFACWRLFAMFSFLIIWCVLTCTVVARSDHPRSQLYTLILVM